MPPNPILVKLKIVSAAKGDYCFLGKKNGANVNLGSRTAILLADENDESLPIYTVAELIYADVLRRIYVSFKDDDGYLHSRSMLISSARATRSGLSLLVGQTYKSGIKSGTILKARQKRNRSVVS